jgi:hypothetical protein
LSSTSNQRSRKITRYTSTAYAHCRGSPAPEQNTSK